MSDAKAVADNTAVTAGAVAVLEGWERVLKALVISPERALEELNSDWTASQEVADVLMRKYRLPFRAGHHFASEVVDYAKEHDIRPTDFPYDQARRIYAVTMREMGLPEGELPMSEAEFRETLDPVAIIRNRATAGGPQPAEMARMLAAAKARLEEDARWTAERRGRIDAALGTLDGDFGRVLARAP